MFTPIIIAQPEAAVPAMGGWLVMKMAAQWQRSPPQGVDELMWSSHAFLALQSGFASMALAGAGGALARWLMCLPIVS